MEPGRTFIIRLYRQTGQTLTGMVEEVRSGRRKPFTNAEELWTALSQCIARDPCSRSTIKRPRGGKTHA